MIENFISRYNYIIPSYQTLQLGAALGITRLALLLGLLYQPMTGAQLPEKVEYRQVSCYYLLTFCS